MKGVRERIQDIKLRLLDTKPIDKSELSRMGIELAALLINVGDMKAQTEQEAYQLKKDWIVNDDCSDTKAETFMRASNQWLEYRKVKVLYDSGLELLQMIKIKIRDVEDEFQNIP